MISVKLFLLAVVFVITSGAVFSEYFKKNRAIRIIAGVVALISSYYLFDSLYKDLHNNIIDEISTKESGNSVDSGKNMKPSNVLNKPPEDEIESNVSEENLARETRINHDIGSYFNDTLKSGESGPEVVVISSIDSNEEDDLEINKKFAISTSEITVGDFRNFINSTNYDMKKGGKGCRRWVKYSWGTYLNTTWISPGYPQTDSHPVVCVSWEDAQKYINWLNDQTGEEYRLPNEDEWKYVALSGSSNRKYWDSTSKDACKFANVADNTGRSKREGGLPDISVGGWAGFSLHDCIDNSIFPAQVKSYKPNSYGVYDIYGNVWEWVLDCGPIASGQVKVGESNSCSEFIVKGGSWASRPVVVNSDYSHSFKRDFRTTYTGFRVLREMVNTL